MIGLVTDSNSQLPDELRDRYDVRVVPLTVTVDGREYLEGDELDADRFFELLAERDQPQVTTAQPPPGRFAEIYAALADAGASEILSIHIGAAFSGTLNSARLGAGASPVPVRLIDTGTASFGVSCCVWEAGEALAAGASAAEAAARAESLAPSLRSTFIVQAVELAARGGRFDGAELAGDGIPVLSLVGGEMSTLGYARTLDEAVEAMVRPVLAAEGPLRVASGLADAAGSRVTEALDRRLRELGHVQELVRYRIGPTVAVHAGPGTAGIFFYRPAQS